MSVKIEFNDLYNHPYQWNHWIFSKRERLFRTWHFRIAVHLVKNGKDYLVYEPVERELWGKPL